MAWGVVYSSATWAKSAKNLKLYSRAFPEQMNVSALTDLMDKGGQDFSEIFSSMLAMDGAFIRREHDLSKIDFSVLVDDKRLPQNEQTITQVSEILGMMTMLSGEINHALHRMNTDTRETLKKAQDRSEEHTSELQSLMRISYAVFCLKKKNT